MKVLYINRALSGNMEHVARLVAQRKDTFSVFLARQWRRNVNIPGLMKVRLQEPDPLTDAAGQPLLRTAEGLLLQNARSAELVKEACLRVRKNGFEPDVVYAAAQDGLAEGVLGVFPEARLVVWLDWFYGGAARQSDGAGRPGEKSRGTELSVAARMHNASQVAVLTESAAGIVTTNWQKKQFGERFADKIHVVGIGVDANFFVPPVSRSDEEIVTFACQGSNAARGIHTICRCLPRLLELRPACRVQLVSFGSRRAEAAKAQYVEELAGLLPALSDAQRQRVDIVVSPPPDQYRDLLQRSTVYVYLTTSTMLSAGLLEAMSCGALVLASAVEPVREVVTHGENGVLWEGHTSEELARDLTQLLAFSPKLGHIQRMARETILKRHDVRQLLPRQAALVLGSHSES